MSWALTIVSSLITFLVVSLIWYLLLERQKNQKTMMEMMSQIQMEKKDLMNRMMSQDLPTYQAMTMASSTGYLQTFNEPYISQTDQSELSRLKDMSGVSGLGDSLYEDSDFTDTMAEFGVNLDTVNSDMGKNE